MCVSLNREGIPVVETVRLLRALRTADCGQRAGGTATVLDGCMHRATVESSDLSIFSVKRIRQTAVAVIILLLTLELIRLY